jgi:hypothetical protein
MAWFNKRNNPSSPGMLPPDIVEWLEATARYNWDSQKNPMPDIRVDAFYFLAQKDRDGFLGALSSVSVPAGGWVALGGKDLVLDILPTDTDTPDFNAIVLAGLQFLRENGVPPIRLSPNDQKFWRRLSGGEPWLQWREPPADTLTPLQPGEVRKVAELLRGDGHTNEILVRQDASEAFTSTIDGPYSETDSTRTRTDWYTAPSLHELYVRIGEGQQTPPHWYAPELAPYFPLPAMRI